ncbi:MAG: Stk1 family PASTA domain-containing Ser/Thr kinase [Oscillospiraceae bacterium]|jgi:serine/threonine-protein kinase|nr:Stk1 family PASTA domain-containing Ser/Thr kinase [Oscillospiraceae bacterium]
MDKYTGKRLDGRYEIHELLGIGGMARVYRAYDMVDDVTVAVKILKDEFLENRDFIRRFKNESKAIAVLSHPNIVKVYDVSFGDMIQYIVVEYIDGITLKEYITQQKEIKWKEAVHFTIQILRALEQAHAKGIIHRDIKPQNMMLLSDGTIKVTDFGIAHFIKKETRTMTEKAIGSVHYISPEQARGDVIDAKADLYSVGVMLYEMLTGKLPFEADSAVSVAIMQLQVEPKPPKEINEDIPDGLQEITLKAMKKNRAQRYKSAADMLDAMAKFQNDPSVRFEYKYFIDDKPTKYVDAINGVQTFKHKENYNDNYTYKERNSHDDIKKKKKWMYALLGIGSAVLVFALGLTMWALINHFSDKAKDIDIPNFIGMKLANAKEDKNFTFATEQKYDPSKPEGVIIEQDPKSGSKKVKLGSKVTLTVNSSSTPVVVPRLEGLSEEEAKAKIKEIGLEVGTSTNEANEAPKGIVIKSEPKEGEEIPRSSSIKLIVSSGPAPKKVPVPDVLNKSVDEAKNLLIKEGFKVEKIVEESSDKPKGTVLSTNPSAGSEVSKGTAVQLTVSKDKPQPAKEEITETPANKAQENKNATIKVDLPQNITKKVNLKVFINGIEDKSKSVTLRPDYTKVHQFSIDDNKGKKQTIVVELDGKKYSVYEVDFEADEAHRVKKIESYPVDETESGSDKNQND